MACRHYELSSATSASATKITSPALSANLTRNLIVAPSAADTNFVYLLFWARLSGCDILLRLSDPREGVTERKQKKHHLLCCLHELFISALHYIIIPPTKKTKTDDSGAAALPPLPPLRVATFAVVVANPK